MYKNIILNSNKETQLLFLVIFVVSIYIFSQTFSVSFSSVFGLVVGLYIIYEIFDYQQNDRDDKNKTLMEKLDYLNVILNSSLKQKTDLGLRIDTYIPGFESSVQIDSYLYLDPDLINFLYSIRDYEQYSPIVFSRMLRGCNYILKIWSDMNLKDPDNKISLKDCNRNYQVAEKLTKTCNNYFHSFVYSLPTDTYYKQKFQKSLSRFRILTRRNLDRMKEICKIQNKQLKINSNTVFIDEFDGPKPNDESEDLPFNWFV